MTVTEIVVVLLSVSIAGGLESEYPTSYLVLVRVENVVDAKVNVSKTVDVAVGMCRYEEQKAVALLILRMSTTSLIPSQRPPGLRR